MKVVIQFLRWLNGQNSHNAVGRQIQNWFCLRQELERCSAVIQRWQSIDSRQTENSMCF